MGRAPNSGAPQRVSAHVVPKARAASSSIVRPQIPEDEEKTTIDSGWAEEASTTVEQGDVAERLRSPGADPARNNITHTTATGAGILEEPTVDDRRGSSSLALLAATAAPARLVVTSGKDGGHELVLEPGKSYTVGRAIDNDLVLTDIAVSRKHFDLRYTEDAWVIVDRGSGNGTLVNGNLEDQPLALVHGDTVEIGNTIFRFDQPSAATRPAPTVDLSVDQSLDQSLDPSFDQPLGQTLERPLGRSPSEHLGQSLADDEEASTIAGKPIRTEAVPLASPASPPPRARPKTMPPPLRPRTASVAPPLPERLPPVQVPLPNAVSASSGPLPAQRVTGPGPVMLGEPRPAVSQRMSAALPSQPPPAARYGYPHAGDLPPQHAPSLAPLLVPTGAPGRDPTSTALVPPAPYGVPSHVAQPYRAPVLSQRAKLVLGGAGLTLFAAIATVAIIKGTSSGRASEGSLLASPGTQGPPAGPNPGATVSPISEAIQGTQPRPASTAGRERHEETQPAPPAEPVIELAGTEPPSDGDKPVPDKPASEEPPREKAPPVEATSEVAKTAAAAKKDPPPTARAPKAQPAKSQAPRESPRKAPPKRVAASDTSGARARADRLYRDKSFSSAAKLLRDAAASAGSKEASQLKSLAGTYEAFGKAFHLGMAPNTPAKQAWDALTRASNYDRSAGNAFGSEINARLGQIAPKAAAAFMAARDYVKAKRAVTLAEKTGNRNSTTDGVRQSLEQAAAQLYRQAQAEMSTDAAAAKKKLKTIQGMVDSKSPWYERAGALLRGR